MNILTFDIEEWFHILANDSTKTEKQWNNYEIRIHKNMERIFHILEQHNQKATFFCLGWIAEKYPEVINEINKRGYEIGSHTNTHQLVFEQDKFAFKNDVEKSIKTLEDCTGKKVRIFRAPGFSITENNTWAFEILTELGIEIDCSIFPAHRAHGGFPTYGKAQVSIININGFKIKEFPISTYPFLSKHLIFSGGGYFRLAPYPIIKNLTKKSDYLMSYLHPRDFDFNQPMIKELPLFRKFKSYVGLKGAENKLNKWLTDFEFIDIATAEKQINWSKVKQINL